jgi:hypothetical protein
MKKKVRAPADPAAGRVKVVRVWGPDSSAVAVRTGKSDPWEELWPAGMFWKAQERAERELRKTLGSQYPGEAARREKDAKDDQSVIDLTRTGFRDTMIADILDLPVFIVRRKQAGLRREGRL